jgi:hypothetical protein
MKFQPKSPSTQLNLPLLHPAPIALPDGKDKELVQALMELLLSAVVSAPVTEGGQKHEQADC